MSEVVWKDLQEMAQRSMEDVSTSLLGRVPYRRDPDSGEYRSVIPYEIRMAAKAHGFVCIAADWKRNVFTFRLRSQVQNAEYFDSGHWGNL